MRSTTLNLRNSLISTRSHRSGVCQFQSLQSRGRFPGTRLASSKPLVLEKPSKYRPPSHPPRLPRKPRSYAPLSERERAQQKQKWYPHMFPPEGTLMHKLLTTRSIHLTITLGTLVSLALFVLIADFRTTTPYLDMVPSAAEFRAHPIASTKRFIEVYQLHAAHISAETAEKRKRKTEDAQKRKEFRRALGLESKPLWENLEQEEEEGYYTDYEGKRKKVKKWFGIW